MPYYPPPSSGGSGLPTTGGTMTGTITSTMGSIAADTPALSFTQTWNNAAVAFKGIFGNVVSTAAAAGARIIDLQASSSSVFSVDTAGVMRTGYGLFSVCVRDSAQQEYDISGSGLNGGLSFNSSMKIAWASGTSSFLSGRDLGMHRNSAGVLEINNGTFNAFRDILVRSVIIDGAPSTAAAGQIAIGADTRTTIGANGAASALTAAPVGYIDINVAGSNYQIPYYNRGA